MEKNQYTDKDLSTDEIANDKIVINEGFEVCIQFVNREANTIFVHNETSPIDKVRWEQIKETVISIYKSNQQIKENDVLNDFRVDTISWIKRNRLEMTVFIKF